MINSQKAAAKVGNIFSYTILFSKKYNCCTEYPEPCHTTCRNLYFWDYLAYFCIKLAMEPMKEEYFTDENIGSESDEMIDEVRNYAGMRLFKPDTDHMALLVIDMQNYFLNPDEHAYVPSAPAILPNVLKLMRTCHDLSVPVFLTRHVNTDKNAGMMSVRWQEMIRESDRRSELHIDILAAGGREIRKSQFDAFYNTPLEEELRKAEVTQIIIAGVMTNLCCETTARSAFVRGFEVVMPVDATAAYNYEFHLATFLNLAYLFTRPVKTKALIEAMHEAT